MPTALDALEFLAQQLGNVVKYDASGNPSIFVPFPKIKAIDLDASLPDHVHPAFIVNGVEYDRLLIGKYMASELSAGGTLYSLPNMPPRVEFTADTFLTRMRAFGGGASGKTVAESGLILLMAKKYGWVPKGNNNYGVDYRDGTMWELAKAYTVGTKRVFQGVEYSCLVAHTSAWENRPDIKPTYWQRGNRIGGVPVASQISSTVPNGYNTLTGSGPMSWMLDGTARSLADIVGNAYEQDYGYRIFDGEIQIIQDNNAAHPTADLSAGSAAWRAILPNVGDNGHTLVAPGTPGTLKWDASAATSGYPILDTVVNIRTTDSASRAFKDLTRNTTNVPYVPYILQELGLFPISGDTTQGSVYIRNDAGAEFFPRRGGYFSHSSGAGLGCEYVSYSRGYAIIVIGARPAFVELA